MIYLKMAFNTFLTIAIATQSNPSPTASQMPTLIQNAAGDSSLRILLLAWRLGMSTIPSMTPESPNQSPTHAKASTTNAVSICSVRLMDEPFFGYFLRGFFVN
ncbi:hypothetical protein IB234_06625 [Pseudomonas sp. PDM16]|uniref:hypothetical protein n=1 Tax=Pseudomonas sp. PDM16 TaxID=2769292 RepID=UPI00178670AC|nr:hypothetical protein [Pseudomonas sp. PDM16]MBD9414232.1 hypothetical protein [Pseudomonas sp. PDM16]